MNKCPHSNRSPTTRGTSSWPPPSNKVDTKPRDIQPTDLIFLLDQASVKSNSDLIFAYELLKKIYKIP